MSDYAMQRLVARHGRILAENRELACRAMLLGVCESGTGIAVAEPPFYDGGTYWMWWGEGERYIGPDHWIIPQSR